MKNKYFTFVALAAAALATSCASDDLAEQKQNQDQSGTRTVTLTASVNEGQTRVGMSKENNTTASFYWHNGDKILVQTKSDESSYSGAEFSTTATTGDKTATFTGTVASGSEVGTYAVYPYDSSNQKHSFTGANKLTYVLPSSYTNYKPGSNIFSKTTTTESSSTTSYPSNPTKMPMLGKITDKSISFKCLGGLAVIRIDQMPAASGTLIVTANEKLSGSFTVDLSADTPELATTSTDVNDADKKVTFNFTDAEKGKVGVFYLPLATGSYSGVKITIDSQTETINYGSLSVARKSVTAIPLYATGTNGALTKFSKIDGNVYTLNGHEFVDFGQNILWAKVNIGATLETEYGAYYTWSAAQNHIWAACRLPTIAEIEAFEKAANITWTWTTEGSVNGCKVTKKDSDNNRGSIFFPAAGYKSGATLIATANYYWSSTPHETTTGHYGALNFTSSGKPSPIYPDGNVQAPVRLVTEK